MENVPTYSATLAYPYANEERATSALPGTLRLQIPVRETADWGTLEVTVPEEVIGSLARRWFKWTGTVPRTI